MGAFRGQWNKVNRKSKSKVSQPPDLKNLGVFVWKCCNLTTTWLTNRLVLLQYVYRLRNQSLFIKKLSVICGCCVMVAQQTLTLLAEVRYLPPVPYKNTLRDTSPVTRRSMVVIQCVPIWLIGNVAESGLLLQSWKLSAPKGVREFESHRFRQI